jgi:uncharacterized hydrophobic protein (TIGR00341 family)
MVSMLRTLQVTVPASRAEALRSLLAEQEVISNWQQNVLGERLVVQLLVRTERAEGLLDVLQQRFAGDEEFRAILLRVHATMPAVPEPEKEAEEGDGAEEKEEAPPPQRVACVEIRNELENGIDMGPVFLATVVLSSIIASVGLIRNNVAVIIGAMVVAPLLTPNMAIAFAVTTGDLAFLRKAARTALVGAVIGFLFALLLGWVSDIDTNAEILARTRPEWSDLVLALASGSAGALAFTSGVSASLVGVMVAVALLPPLIVSGVMLGQGHRDLAIGAVTLLAINAICVVLAAVSTFAWRGVGPRTLWEKDKARRYTRRAVLVCSLLAAALLLLVGIAWR